MKSMFPVPLKLLYGFVLSGAWPWRFGRLNAPKDSLAWELGVREEKAESRASQLRRELGEMRQAREQFEAKAEALEGVLQKEREEHQAWLESRSESMAKDLQDLSTGVEGSIAESFSLMKARLIEAEGTVRKLVNQLNGTFQEPLKESKASRDPEELANAMTKLLEEHQQLMKRQQLLMAQRGTNAPHAGSLALPPQPASCSIPTAPQAEALNSPRQASDPTQRRGDSGSPRRSLDASSRMTQSDLRMRRTAPPVRHSVQATVQAKVPQSRPMGPIVKMAL
ncbi:unnamed protein product [Effrenium voratum]|uniref:Uncharacterized protein n=1 Tax=Effrenium voratum TaxID=2562239 RepID=A0AA36NBP2_9DINO|nr:unnamed protein product [Effrenium voratum]